MRHRTLPVWGVQFHPESIFTPHGKQLLKNFLRPRRMLIRRALSALLCWRRRCAPARRRGTARSTSESGGPGAAGRALRDGARAPARRAATRRGTRRSTPGRVYPTSVVVLNSDVTVRRHGAGRCGRDQRQSPPHRHRARRRARCSPSAGTSTTRRERWSPGGVRRIPAARYDTVRTERGLGLVYRGPPRASIGDLFVLPGFYGFPVPLYDRVDGLSVGWGPELQFGDSVLIVAPSVLYRSNLGAWDGALACPASYAGRLRARSRRERTTSSQRRVDPAGLREQLHGALLREGLPELLARRRRARGRVGLRVVGYRARHRASGRERAARTRRASPRAGRGGSPARAA